MTNHKEKSNKEMWGFWGAIIAALITGFVALIIADKIPWPPFAPTQTPTATSSDTEISNWNITFEYRFPPGFWSVGNHQYTIVSNCPTNVPDDSGSVTQDFVVSDNFEFVPREIYLRWVGVKKSKELGAVSADGVNPSQRIVAVNVFFNRTKSEIEWIAANCTCTVSWDGGAQNQPMTPQTPYQR
jgi:hypothetical protein